MTERITSITMQAFRGVAQPFTLDLDDGQSCVILGDNGTGKSSIADAVEWYFTGQIDLLTKEGRASAVRHTGAATSLDTKVAVSTDGSLSGAITRSTPSPQAALLAGRAELVILRGRTLGDFIDKTKGDKWKALSELLGLDAIDQVRLDLQRARNELEDKEERARGDLTPRVSWLASRVSEVSEPEILQAIRQRCEAVEIEPPESLASAGPAWLESTVPAGSSSQRAAALTTTRTQLRTASEASVDVDALKTWNRFVDQAAPDQRPLSLYQAAESLLSSGYVTEGHCPLCGQPVDIDELQARLTTELQNMEGAARALDTARRSIRRFVGSLRDAQATRKAIMRAAAMHEVKLGDPPNSPDVELSPHIEAVSRMSEAVVHQYLTDLAEWDTQALATIESAIPAPATERDQLLLELGVFVREADAWRTAALCQARAQAAFDLADRVFTSYQEHQLRYFQQTIQQISKNVVEIYQFLHSEGGIGAVGIETVGDKGAELSVVFHGRRELPPHRVLSESHLNSLGIALFLAMAETFNETLGFLVLDDIVNSFDREHRGRLSELLVKRFEKTQLIILTHDEIFFTQLSRRTPRWLHQEFMGWTFETGPRTKKVDSNRILRSARETLGEGDRVSAAQQGRRALEEFLQEACEELEAHLPFRRGRRNDRREVEEVMRGLRRTLKERASNLHAQTKSLFNGLEADLQASLNVESHANQGGASTQEVGDALERIAQLQGRFTCGECDTRVWHAGTPESSRCNCGGLTFPPSRDTGSA